MNVEETDVMYLEVGNSGMAQPSSKQIVYICMVSVLLLQVRNMKTWIDKDGLEIPCFTINLVKVVESQMKYK